MDEFLWTRCSIGRHTVNVTLCTEPEVRNRLGGLEAEA